MPDRHHVALDLIHHPVPAGPQPPQVRRPVRERLGRPGIIGQPVDGVQYRTEAGGIISEEPRRLVLLRALRAWGGNPGVMKVAKHQGPGHWVTRATFYTALNPGRTSLPPLRVVRPLVLACGADLEEWVSAWRALSLREFDKANPPPTLPEYLVPLTGPNQDDTVRPLERPAQ